MKVICMVCNQQFELSPLDQNYEKYDKMSEEERKGYICEHCANRVAASAQASKKNQRTS